MSLLVDHQMQLGQIKICVSRPWELNRTPRGLSGIVHLSNYRPERSEYNRYSLTTVLITIIKINKINLDIFGDVIFKTSIQICINISTISSVFIHRRLVQLGPNAVSNTGLRIS